MMTRKGFLVTAGVAAASAGSGLAMAEEQATKYADLLKATDWLGDPPDIPDSEIAEVVETDVLVIGGGNAGIQAQLAAAEGGAKVDVVEKLSEETRKVKGEDVGHVNSQWLIDQGFGPFNVGEVVTEFCLRSGGRVNPEIVRKYVANSGEMFDNMVSLVTWPNERIKQVQTIGEDLSPLDPSQCIVQVTGASLDGPVEYPIVRGGFKSWPGVAQFMGTIRHDLSGAGGIAAFSRLDEFQQFAIIRAQDLGARWHYDEAGVKLLTDDNGDVIGAVTKKGDGSYVKYLTSLGVILATGDFSGNYEMLVNLCPEPIEWVLYHGGDIEQVGGMGEQGDGHRMACWIGAQMEPYTRSTLAIGSGAGGPWGLTPMLWLNSEGKRFMNEASIQMDLPFSRVQPDGNICCITDANYALNVKNAGLDHWAPNFGRVDYFTEMCEDIAAVPVDDPAGGECRNMYVAERDAKVVYAASTIEGLLGILGYEGDSLKNALAAVERYNELCEAGEDSDFGKDLCLMNPIKEPPFYASANYNDGGSSFFTPATLAGLMTNDDLQVLDSSGRPIGGLYAVGNCLGMRYGLGYVAPFAGNSIGMAMTHGRVAGKLITGQPVK